MTPPCGTNALAQRLTIDMLHDDEVHARALQGKGGKICGLSGAVNRLKQCRPRLGSGFHDSQRSQTTQSNYAVAFLRLL
jgi:hypothetical protein